MTSNLEKAKATLVNISCLVVEDDMQCRDYVLDILEESKVFNAVYEAKDLKEAEALLASHETQLLILDINLPDGDSLGLLTKLNSISPEIKYNIIFTTAFSNYAVEAFKFSALDYLLKPFTPEELLLAVHKAVNAIGNHQYQRQLETFFYNHREKDAINKKIVLKSMENIHIVKVVDIMQAVSDNNYTIFHLSNGERVTVSQPLKSYESKLKDCGFMRIHQSHLVNLSFIKSFQKKKNLLVLENESQLPVSQSKRALLMAYFEGLD